VDTKKNFFIFYFFSASMQTGVAFARTGEMTPSIGQ
jgi:hypothetical protein